MPSIFEPSSPLPPDPANGNELLARVRRDADARRRKSDADAEHWQAIGAETAEAIGGFIKGMIAAGCPPTDLSFSRRTKANRSGRLTNKPYEYIPRSAVKGWTIVCGENPRARRKYVVTVDGSVFEHYQDNSPGAHKRFGQFTPIAAQIPSYFRAALEHELKQVLLGNPPTAPGPPHSG